MDFTSYCESKKIDPLKFQSVDPELFKSWEYLYSCIGTISFTQQKLFMINDIRRRFKLVKTPISIDNLHNPNSGEIKSGVVSKPLGFKPKLK